MRGHHSRWQEASVELATVDFGWTSLGESLPSRCEDGLNRSFERIPSVARPPVAADRGNYRYRYVTGGSRQPRAVLAGLGDTANAVIRPKSYAGNILYR